MLDACGPNQASPSVNPAGQVCGPPAFPSAPITAVTTGIAEYKAPGLIGIERVISGPDGNLWFLGGASSLHEVVGRMTPSGQFTIYPLVGGGGFDGITVGPDGNIWFTESNLDRIDRLVPATGQITPFLVPLPPVRASSTPHNTQVTDIVAGPDGALWFDVQQIANDLPGYVGRISTTGLIQIFVVPGQDQPIGIQVGADGNLWSRIAVSAAATQPCQLPGYTPTSRVVRVTTSGRVSELDETSPSFSGYTVAANGDRWWMTSKGKLRRVTSSGQVKEFPAGTNLGFWDAFHIIVGPDGNVWYTDGADVVRMTPNGSVSIYRSLSPNAGATWVARGPDNRIWFVEGASGAATLGAINAGAN